jgi:L-alanine-DL-glutamate epimerase-like enolase superfamily enzyme
MYKHLAHFDTAMACEDGRFRLPEGPGLGIAPRPSLWQFAVA